jgi:hypothetical protein
MPLDPEPRVHLPAREHWPRARPPVSNRLWRPELLLELALAGAYPSAEGGRSEPAKKARKDEIAYWRQRLAGHDALDEDHDARPVIE